MSRAANAFLFPVSFMTGFGFLESIYLVGMVLATADKWKAPVYRLCCVALAAQILSQLLICVGIDFVISPYVASPLLLGFATLIVSLANHVAMICVDCAAMLLIYTFFKGKKMMLIGWFALSGFCILLRVAASIYLLATNTLLSGSNDTSLNYASTSVYVIYSLLVSLNSIVESVYISMAAVVFIRHMIKQLDLPPFEIFKDMILKYGGLKFAALVGIRFFGAGLIIRLVTRNYVADNVTNMANYLTVVHQSYAIFVVFQTAFFVTKELLSKGRTSLKIPDSILSESSPSALKSKRSTNK